MPVSLTEGGSQAPPPLSSVISGQMFVHEGEEYDRDGDSAQDLVRQEVDEEEPECGRDCGETPAAVAPRLRSSGPTPAVSAGVAVVQSKLDGAVAVSSSGPSARTS